MEPVSDALDISAVAGATWNATAQGNSKDLTRQVNCVQASSTFVVNLPKWVTTQAVPGLARDFKRALATDQPCIILDLTDVQEMDTSGLDLLLEWLRETLRRDGTVSLRGISPEAATILELTGFDHVLSMFSESPQYANTEPRHESLLEHRPGKQLAP